MLLPKRYQIVEVPGGYSQDMPHIRLASVSRPDSVCSRGQCDLAIQAKINDYLYIRIETVQMPRLMVHCVSRKPDSTESDRAHLYLF